MNTFTVTIHLKDKILTKAVEKDSFTIGRSLDCDIPLNETLVSRVHVVVSRRWNQIWIEDKNSSNGTFVNGNKIVQSTPVNVLNTDKIQLGKSEFIIFIDLQSDELPPEEKLPELSPEQEAELAEPMEENTVAAPSANLAPFQAEKIVHEAKRKAAQIILEGETQAEKRVQVIYQKARDTQAQADVFYSARIAEAHKEADAILADFQRQGHHLLHEARTMAQELREEVDVYVQTLKQKAKADVEEMTSEATLKAERMKEEALEQGEAKARAEAEDLMARATEDAERSVQFAKSQVAEIHARAQADKDNLANVEAALKATSAELAKARESLTQYQSEEKTLREKLAADDAAVRERMANDDKAVRDKMTADEKALRDRLTAEEKRFKDKVAADEKAHKEKVLADEKAFKEKVAAEDKTFKEKLAAQNEQLKGISKSHVDLTAACRKMEEEYKKLLERQGSITMAIGDLETKKGLLQKDFDGQKAVMMEKFEGEKSQFVKSEQERMEDMRQEMNKRMQKMEQDLLDDMIAKKTAMIKEIYGLIEREVVKVMDAAQWNLISSQVEAHVTEAVNGRVATLSQSTVTSAKPVNLMKKRKMERIRWVSAGLTMGAAIYFGAESIVNVMNQDSTPLRTIAAAEEKKRLDDLEKRKFNPPQTDELKDTYTDAVIYTRDFSKIYLNDDFQNRLFKNTAQYMLKTWRIDEQVTLKALAASKALVQELGDRKTKIHPDFVKDGVDKMHDFEKETLTRLQDILGSEVKLESYRRNEKKFFEEELQRRPASQSEPTAAPAPVSVPGQPEPTLQQQLQSQLKAAH